MAIYYKYMTKTEIESIILINLYFTTCKLTEPSSHKTEMVRKYLLRKLNKILAKKENKSDSSSYGNK